MIQINTTFCIQPSDSLRFLAWVREIYLTAVNNIENSDARLMKICADNPESESYAVQFTVANLNQANSWTTSFLPQLAELASSQPYILGPDRLLHFTTLMEIL